VATLPILTGWALRIDGFSSHVAFAAYYYIAAVVVYEFAVVTKTALLTL
jgi:hypothetical protein